MRPVDGVPKLPYTRTIYARWGDMDFNGHMRNTAYLDAAGDIRMCFFGDHGYTMRDFARLQIGPVILRDVLEYYRELHLLEQVVVGHAVIGMSADGSHWRMRNGFCRPDGERIARVESSGGWLDLRTRRWCRRSANRDRRRTVGPRRGSIGNETRNLLVVDRDPARLLMAMAEWWPPSAHHPGRSCSWFATRRQ